MYTGLLQISRLTNRFRCTNEDLCLHVAVVAVRLPTESEASAKR